MNERSADEYTPETLRPVANEPFETPVPADGLRVERFVSKPPVGLLVGLGALMVGVLALLAVMLKPMRVTDLGGIASPAEVPGLRPAPAAQPVSGPGPAAEREARAQQQIEAVGTTAVQECLGVEAVGVTVGISAAVAADGTLGDVSVGPSLSDEQAKCVISHVDGARVDPSAASQGRLNGLVQIPSP